MNKKVLYYGMGMAVVGGILLIINVGLNSIFDSILFGFGFSLLISGIAQVGRYVYWSQPDKRTQYKEKIKQEKIEMHDEFKEKLRATSIRYTYIFELSALALAILLFSIIGKLGYIISTRLVIGFLGAMILAQLLISQLIYNYLLKKYL